MKDEHVYVEIPLDREGIAFLERESKGADVRLRLDVEVSATELVAIGQTKDQFPRTVWGFIHSHLLQGQISAAVYSVSHGRFIEMLLKHFDVYFVEARATALPDLGDAAIAPH